METESRAPGFVERAPMGQRGFEQRVGADQIGVDEGRGTVDRAVDMALGGEVQHGVRLLLAEDGIEAGAVADIDLVVAMTVAHAGLAQRFEVAGIGELVDVGYAPIGIGHDVADHGRADETGAAGDENSHDAAIPMG